MKNTLVTGGSGLLGNALKNIGLDNYLYPNSKELNLLNREDVFKFVEKEQVRKELEKRSNEPDTKGLSLK